MLGTEWCLDNSIEKVGAILVCDSREETSRYVERYKKKYFQSSVPKDFIKSKEKEHIFILIGTIGSVFEMSFAVEK